MLIYLLYAVTAVTLLSIPWLYVVVKQVAIDKGLDVEAQLAGTIPLFQGVFVLSLVIFITALIARRLGRYDIGIDGDDIILRGQDGRMIREKLSNIERSQRYLFVKGQAIVIGPAYGRGSDLIYPSEQLVRDLLPRLSHVPEITEMQVYQHLWRSREPTIIYVIVIMLLLVGMIVMFEFTDAAG